MEICAFTFLSGVEVLHAIIACNSFPSERDLSCRVQREFYEMLQERSIPAGAPFSIEGISTSTYRRRYVTRTEIDLLRGNVLLMFK